MLGPIAVRLSYELMMLLILLVKNVISINRKLSDQTGGAGSDIFDMHELTDAVRHHREAAQARSAEAAAHSARYCKLCGAELENGVCPKCPPQHCKLCGSQLVNGLCPKCSAPTEASAEPPSTDTQV